MQRESADQFRWLAGFLIVVSLALLTGILWSAPPSPSLPRAHITRGRPQSVRKRPTGYYLEGGRPC